MAGQLPGTRAIQTPAEDTPPIGAKGGEPPAFLPVFLGSGLCLSLLLAVKGSDLESIRLWIAYDRSCSAA